jgi:hypothetical protein
MSRRAWLWWAHIRVVSRRSSLVSHNSQFLAFLIPRTLGAHYLVDIPLLRFLVALPSPFSKSKLTIQNSSFRRSLRLFTRQFDDVEVFLRDNRMADAEPELVAAGRRKDQGRNVNGEIGNLKPIGDIDRRERRSADQFIGIEKKEIDIKLISPLGVRQAKVHPQLLVLERERGGSKVREDADQAFLPGGAVFNDTVADKEGLDTRTMKSREGIHSLATRCRCAVSRRRLDYPKTAVPPRASKTSPNRVWSDPTRQKCEVISISWPRWE